MEDHERLVTSVWEEILGTTINADSDFFSVGGDSLKMMTMLFRIEEELNVALSPTAVFENPTVKQFAHFLSEIRNDFYTLGAS
jgi:iturin family lipopeptide synthetase A